ncbi:MAG: hypothetical protein HYT62_03950 [Candidatus Yanofskybacteria bacterium]|nr:hypothetical protein [Candidatus Yanofskybacteria bacterium]
MKSKKWVSSKRRDHISKGRRDRFRFHDPAYAQQRAVEGRLLEERVAGILTVMKQSGEVREFIRHLPNSPEDHEGKDFTVSLGDYFFPISFGITCSFNSYKKYFQAHPGLECLWITSGQTDEDIQKMIRILLIRLQVV